MERPSEKAVCPRSSLRPPRRRRARSETSRAPRTRLERRPRRHLSRDASNDVGRDDGASSSPTRRAREGGRDPGGRIAPPISLPFRDATGFPPPPPRVPRASTTAASRVLRGVSRGGDER
eukprot:31547-Pelagococcus_subviridis.AAC.5